MGVKKLILGILLGVTVLSHPISSEAHERQCPKTIEVTYAEAQELMEIASAEALNQGEDGMLLVMSVIINRVNSSEYPNTIHGVIHQSHQFYTKGMLEMGNLYPELVAFERKDNNALDVYYSEAFTHGDHTFYTCKH